MPTDIQAFTRTLEGRRLALGMSVAELSGAIGVPVQTLTRWRTTETTRPPYNVEDVHRRMCVLETTMGFLIKMLSSGRPIPLEPDSLPAGFTPGMYQVAVARAADLMRQEGLTPMFE